MKYDYALLLCADHAKDFDGKAAEIQDPHPQPDVFCSSAFCWKTFSHVVRLNGDSTALIPMFDKGYSGTVLSHEED